MTFWLKFCKERGRKQNYDCEFSDAVLFIDKERERETRFVGHTGNQLVRQWWLVYVTSIDNGNGKGEHNPFIRQSK